MSFVWVHEFSSRLTTFSSCRHRGSNHWPLDHKACALTLQHGGLQLLPLFWMQYLKPSHASHIGILFISETRSRNSFTTTWYQWQLKTLPAPHWRNGSCRYIRASKIIQKCYTTLCTVCMDKQRSLWLSHISNGFSEADLERFQVYACVLYTCKAKVKFYHHYLHTIGTRGK